MLRFLLVVSVILLSGNVGADEASELLGRFDRLSLQATKYREASETARAIRDLAKQKGDQQLKARGLMRMAFAELHYGSWNLRWEKWRNQAAKLAGNADEPSVARAES